MRRFAGLAQETLAAEMELHLAFAAEWEIALEELETAAIAPTTRAYTDFLLRTAALGDYSELLAALLPCAWGCSWLGLELATEEHTERYARRIDLYASREFTELADWLRDVTDEIVPGAGEGGPSPHARGVSPVEPLRARVLGGGLAPRAGVTRPDVVVASDH